MKLYQAVNDLAWDHNGLVQRPSVVVFMENAEVRMSFLPLPLFATPSVSSLVKGRVVSF
jgi:hypothetical protein